MERNLGTDITVDQDGSAHISIYDNDNERLRKEM